MFDSLLSLAGPLIGGMMGSDTASEAAGIQANATNAATGEQRRQFDLNRQDLAPYRGLGSAAVMRLRDLLGIGGGGADGGGRSLDDIKRELAASGRFGSAGGQSGGQLEKAINFEETANGGQFVFADGTRSDNQYRMAGGAGGLDNAALNAEAERIYSAQGPSAASQSTSGQLSPGSVLSRRMTMDDLLNDTVYNQSGIVKAGNSIDPSVLTKKFSVADFYDDPVVKLGMDFGLTEGRKAIDRGAGAAGLRNSGATLKELTRFGTDYAGGMADASRGRFIDDQGRMRDLMAYGDVMRSGAEDRFTGNQDRTFNQLAGVSGLGQTAASTGASLGTGLSGNIANLISAGGNAQAASKLAGSNAMTNAFSTMGNWWNQQNMLDKLSGMRGASSIWKPAAGSYSGMAVPMGGGYLNTGGWE